MTGPADTIPDQSRQGPARRTTALITAAAVVLLLISAAAGYMAGSARATPDEGGTDVGFARDMQTHHGQAVQMAIIIRDKTTDPILRTVAEDIATSQQHQAGQMYAWLVQWGLPQTGTDPATAWMAPSEAAAPDTMMGMATPEQVQALQQATGTEAEGMFLELMIAHHKGGVAMAKAALEGTERQEVRTLAGAIDAAQTAEITQLQQLLARR